LKYLPPVQKPVQPPQDETEEDFQKILQANFAKHTQVKFAEITGALEAGDIKLAHRLAHTLKGNAGQIGKTGLQKAAADVEKTLKDGENLTTRELLLVLETELNKVLEELAPKN
jgi:HPt (histidine-containing phosphotransfer) domain-containing protein